MVEHISSFVGLGVYTPKEAAMYSRIHVNTLNRWLFGAHGSRVMQTRFENERIVTFLDFVQAMAVRAIRINHNVPLARIRDVIEYAREQHGLPYPFAMKHRTKLFGDEILLQVFPHGKGKPVYVETTRGLRGQVTMPEVIELYVKDLSFDAEGLANRYQAYVDPDSHSRIIMDPKRQFGQPIMDESGYSALVLCEAVNTEGSIPAAARAFGVKDSEIQAALRYQDHLIGAA